MSNRVGFVSFSHYLFVLSLWLFSELTASTSTGYSIFSGLLVVILFTLCFVGVSIVCVVWLRWEDGWRVSILRKEEN